jgi:hypothetical protein
MHVHVSSPDGEAKFLIVPRVALAEHAGYSKQQLAEITRVVEKHAKEIEKAWQIHFTNC